MTIDIIDLTDPKYDKLSTVQLAMVRAAQAKKDAATRKCQEAVEEIFYHFLGRNTARSTALARETQALYEALEEEVESLRADLEFQLEAENLENSGNENGPYRYPENPNYSLSYSQRFLVVREYYMNVTSDPSARLEAYRLDTLARSYLGEYYATLYDLLATYVK